MPGTSLSAAAQLAKIANPLGGTSKSANLATASPLRGAGQPATGDFSDLLAEQLGPSDASGTAASDPLSQLSALLGGSGDAGTLAGSPMGGLSSLGTVSPQLAQAIARAKASAPSQSGRVQRAISWAQSHLGQHDWDNLCERFVEEAYGTRDVFPTAAEAGRALVTHRGRTSWQQAPVGSLLYFAGDASNDFNGHAAIYLGNGRMISATPSGVQEERVDTPYYADRLLGWADPAQLPNHPVRAAVHPNGTAAPLPTGAAGAAGASENAVRPATRVSNPVPLNVSSHLLSGRASTQSPLSRPIAAASTAPNAATVPLAHTFASGRPSTWANPATRPAAPAAARSTTPTAATPRAAAPAPNPLVSTLPAPRRAAVQRTAPAVANVPAPLSTAPSTNR